MMLEILGGSNEGGHGVYPPAFSYGLSAGTISNYFRHALSALCRAFDAHYPTLVSWPVEVERKAMEGTIINFPKCIVSSSYPSNRTPARAGFTAMNTIVILESCEWFRSGALAI